MPRLCFIVNPTAGHGRALKTWKQIEPLVASLGDYVVKFTEHPGHGQELAREAAQEGFDRVVALGGDGTVNEVASGLVGTAAAFGLVPTGTGNDFRRAAGIPKDPVEAVRTVFQGQPVPMDVGLAGGRRYFFNVAGAGFDAEVMRRVNGYGPVLKSVGGVLPHLLGVAGTLLHLHGSNARAALDGQSIEIPNMALMVAGIGQYFGGGIKIFPHAVTNDGLFDVIWGENLSRGELVSILAKIFSGEHENHPKVHIARARRISMAADSPMAVQVDGELIGQLPIDLELLPGALQVVLPR